MTCLYPSCSFGDRCRFVHKIGINKKDGNKKRLDEKNEERDDHEGGPAKSDSVPQSAVHIYAGPPAGVVSENNPGGYSIRQRKLLMSIILSLHKATTVPE